jgi:hypothetical protein
MTTFKSIMRRLGAPLRGAAAGREIEDELRFHIELRARDNIAAGMSPEDAVADAMRRFGDFDQIRDFCEGIRKERLAGIMKVIKGCAWVILGCGLMLKMSSNIVAVVGDFLILIALLWRLLIYLRETQPDRRRVITADQPPPSAIHTIGDLSVSSFTEDAPKPVPTYDKAGRTPVERLISDESSDGAVN